jgi:twitching motility two-component system response regulator PilG
MMPERAALPEEHQANTLQRAVAEIKSGNKTVARELLKKVCKATPLNVAAWLWRASVAETPLEALSHLEQVLRISPTNPTALAWISTIRDSTAEPVREAPAAPVYRWECPCCGHAADRDHGNCPACHAVTTLDLDAILLNQGVDEPRVRAAIERLQHSPDHESNFVVQHSLAVAWLNLLNSSEALKCLQRASRLRPQEAVLRDKIAAISGRRLVMVVDDSPTIRTVISRTLERAAYRALAVANGMEALSHMDEETPAFVLLDVSMPFIDGYQLCKAIKGHPKTRRVPVVMLSGNDGFFDKVKGRMAGAETYLTKPCAPALLLRTVREYAH